MNYLALLRALATDAEAKQLGPLHVQIVGFLAGQKGHSAHTSVIMAGLGVKPVSLSVSTDRLVTDGFLTREDDPADRRRCIFALTPKGLALSRRLQRATAESGRSWPP